MRTSDMAVKRAAAKRATDRCVRQIQLRRQPRRPDYFRDVFEWLRKPRRNRKVAQENWLRGKLGAGRIQRVRDARRIEKNRE
jgi:hypothetical protein